MDGWCITDFGVGPPFFRLYWAVDEVFVVGLVEVAAVVVAWSVKGLGLAGGLTTTLRVEVAVPAALVAT